MRKEHLKLSEQEHSYLTTLTTSGNLKARQFKRAMTLLGLDQGQTMSAVSKAFAYSYPSVVNLKKNFLTIGVACLEEKPRSGRPIVFNGVERARITALACSETPLGH